MRFTKLLQRKRFLINPKFQFRFAFYLCTWVLALSAIFPFLLSQTFMLLAEQLVSNPSGPEVDYVIQVRNELLRSLYLVEGLFILVVAGISVFISHRIAGPIYKLNQCLREAARTGELNPNLKFRSTDHFQELADSYNALARAILQKQNEKQNSKS
ncbi:MAG: hypothetical protein ACK5QT_02095 [Oligoflexia bacterium]